MPNYMKYTAIAFLAGLLFIPFLGNVHLFDWDEINFAECAREMIVSKDYLRAQIDFMPFWEKPPFFIWMQALAMKVFGVGEFAARLPNALAGVATLMILFYAGRRVANEKLAGWWVLLYAATWLPHFYFKSGIIDPIFNLFIFLSFFQVHLLRSSDGKPAHAVFAGLFLGMAVLTKGPVAILVALLALCVYLVVNRGVSGYKIKHLLLVAFCAFIPILLWMGSAIAVHGMAYGKWFINEFITYQVRLFSTEDADHGGPFVYHFIVLLFGCFPASVFLFQYTRKRDAHRPQAQDFTRWMWILFWVVLILFSIVKTKIVHYSSLCYFPLTYLAALQLYRLGYGHQPLKRAVKWLLLFTGTIVALLITLLPVIGINKQKLIPYIQDPFAVGNFAADVSWSYTESIWGILYLLGIWIAVYAMKKDFVKGMMALCIIQLVTIQVTVLHFTPKIEAYSQRAAIEYFKSVKGKDVYMRPLGYMSYAHLFYTQKLPATDSNYYSFRLDSKGRKIAPIANQDWLLNGVLDKPAYFICKIQSKARFAALPQLEFIGEKNGFVFFKRKEL